MIPLAVSGPILMGTVVCAAIALLAVLLRLEDRDQAEQRSREERLQAEASAGNGTGPHGASQLPAAPDAEAH